LSIDSKFVLRNSKLSKVRTWIEIAKRPLFSNLRYFAKRARGTSIIAMIKSNAYGHGLVLVARLLANSKLQNPNGRLWFGVDSITEALRLRKESIKNRILVMGYTLPARLKEAEAHKVTITISHFEGLAELAKLKRQPQFHLKLDTGMHRQGFQEGDMPRLISVLQRHQLNPEGIYSHLAMASNAAFSKKQSAVFERCLAALKQAGVTPKLAHFNKTEGIVNFPKSRYNIVRLGIGLYGYYPTRKLPLKPVLTWKTIVSEVKKIPKGDYVSYDLAEKVSRDTTIAILPVGYWHGFDRGLSSAGEVLIHGKRARVLGRVTMDMVAVDITDINRDFKDKGLRITSSVKVGDEVVIIGQQGREKITADEMADKIGTTAYEVLTRINPLIYKKIL